MKKILIFSFAAILGLVACTERPEQIIDPVYDRLFSPTDLEADVQNIVNVTLTWQKVENAEGYSVELYKTAAPELIVRNADIEETSCTFENLDENVEYGARVQANSAKIPASYWTTVTFTTTPPPPPVTTEWNFSDDEFADITSTDYTNPLTTVRGLDVIAGTAVRRSAINTPVEIDGYTFTYLLDLRGGGTWDSDLANCRRVIHFKADKPCVVTVYGQSTAVGRTLKITDKNNNTLGEILTTGSTTPDKVDVNVAEAGDIYIYSGGSGINVYLVKMVVGGVYEPDHTATLRSLAVADETLVPAFDPGIFEYTVNVAKSVEKVTINAAKDHPNQTVEGDGEHVLTGNATELPVRVTAEDGATINTYNITVNREATASSDATLKTLTVSPGDLLPAFDPDVTEYTVTTTAEKVTITAVANHKFAKVGNNGNFEVDNLVVNVPNTVNIPVLAEDLTTKIYTVTIMRQASSGGVTTKWWNFSDVAFQNELPGTFTQDYAIDGLDIIAGSEMRYNTNSKALDGYSFTHRLQLNGTGSITSRTLKFDVEDPTTITVYMVTGSGSSVRPLVVHNGAEELTRLNTDGSDIGKYVYNYTGSAGSIYLYSGDSGINLYGVKVETISGGGSGGDDTPGTIVNGFYVVSDGEYIQTTEDNVKGTLKDWVSATSNVTWTARTKCYTGTVANIGGNANRIVTFKVKGASSFTVQVDGNGSRYLTYTINGGNPITSKTYINGCDTEDVNTGTTGECTIEIGGNGGGSVYLHGITFHK